MAVFNAKGIQAVPPAKKTRQGQGKNSLPKRGKKLLRGQGKG